MVRMTRRNDVALIPMNNAGNLIFCSVSVLTDECPNDLNFNLNGGRFE